MLLNVCKSPAVCESKPETTALLLVCGGLLSLFAWLGYYSFPIADDLGYAISVRQEGVLPMFSGLYFTLSGRYFSNLMFALFGLIVDNRLQYHLTPLMHLLGLVFTLRALVGACHKGSPASSWLMTFCLAALFVSSMPSLSQGLYWQCGSLVYFLPFNATFGLAALLAHAAFSSIPLRFWHHLLVAFFLVVIMGSNEVNAVGGAFFLVLATGVAYTTNHARRRYFLLVTLMGIALLCAAVFAPGNFVRAESISTSNGRWEWGFVFEALYGGFKPFKWFFITALLPCLFYFSLIFQPRWQPRVFSQSLGRRLILVVCLGVMLFFGEYLLVFISSKRAPYARIMNAIFHGWFLFGFGTFLYFFGNIQQYARKRQEYLGAVLFSRMLAGLIVILICLQSNVYDATRNMLNGEFAAYRAVWLKRFTLIPPYPQGKEMVLELPALSSRPSPLFFRDLDPKQSKHAWIPMTFARYYGLKGIRIVYEKGDIPTSADD